MGSCPSDQDNRFLRRIFLDHLPSDVREILTSLWIMLLKLLIGYLMTKYVPFLKPIKPGLHEPQLQVERSVTFDYSLVVQRRCSLEARSGVAGLQ